MQRTITATRRTFTHARARHRTKWRTTWQPRKQARKIVRAMARDRLAALERSITDAAMMAVLGIVLPYKLAHKPKVRAKR